MEIRIRATNTVVFESEFRSMHPTTSFPPILTSELLDSFGADPVLNGAQPNASRYQVVARDGVEQIDGQWFTKFIAVDMEQESIDALNAQQAASVRSQRNQKLAECDWTQLADSTADREAWAQYRQALRAVPEQAGFPWEVVWPTIG